MTAISVQHCSFVLYSHLGVDTEAERERRAVKQFPPSESHSDPHRGNWEADPCQAVTANTFKQRVRALGRLAIREPNQQLKKKKKQL